MNYHQVVYLYTCIMSFPKRERKYGTVPNASVVRHCRGRFRGCFASSSQPALIPIALLSFPWRAGGGPNFLQPSPRRCPPEMTACARSDFAAWKPTGARVANDLSRRPTCRRGFLFIARVSRSAGAHPLQEYQKQTQPQLTCLELRTTYTFK